VIGAASSLGSHYAVSSELGRARRGRHGRSAVVFPCKQSTVLACGLLVLHLRRNRSAVRFVGVGCLLRRRARSYSAPSAVKCHMRMVVYDDRLVVDVGHVRDVGDRPVVEESAPAQFPTLEATAEVSEPVINAAIETNVRAPIAGIPNVEAIVPTPISGCPQKAHFRSQHPGARHPVVAVIVAPGPITGCPQIAGSGANGLRVNRQRRRSESHGNPYANLGRRWGRKRRWNNQQQESERQEPNYTLQFHFFPRAPWACPGITAAPGRANLAQTLARNESATRHLS